MGIDMRSGLNVGLVLNGHDLIKYFKNEKFELITCFDTFEHDDKFWLTMEGMKEVCKSDGWILIGVPGRNALEHFHPKDYWRFYPDAVKSLMEGLNDVYIESQKDDPAHEDWDAIYAWGQKS